MQYVIFLLIFLVIQRCTEGSTVYELSDRFLQVRNDENQGMWIVKFYAPWCGHCKKLEPIWSQVAQALHQTPVKVGRVDCTRYQTMAREFNIGGYPTILFVKGPKTWVYKGDRTKEEIVDFALRVSGPPVKLLETFDDYEKQRKRYPVFFTYLGPQNDKNPLWESYYHTAEHFQTTNFFFLADPNIFGKELELEAYPGVVVFKDGTYDVFSGTAGESVNSTLFEWINRERFTLFPKITHGTFPHFMQTKKYVVMAVLEENKVGNVSPDMMRFREMVQGVLNEHKSTYKNYFQFGWTGHPDIANSIAMASLPIPSLIVIESGSYKYMMPDVDPEVLTPEIVEDFLQQVMNGNAKTYGGDGFFFKLYRLYFEAATALAGMWKGNPVLTSVLFGLPMGFLSVICYSIWCSDILDAPDEEYEEERMKRAKKE